MPRKYQWPLWNYWVREGGLKAAAVWHRRAGKDDVCLHGTCIKAHERVGTYWHMLPEAAQARKAIWTAVNPMTGMRRIDEAFPPEIRANTNDTEMFIRFKNGSTWQVVGSDNFNSLVGSPPIGVVLSEWSIANPAAWAYLLPILTENGGWAIFIYTPRGKNHGERTYKRAMREAGWFGELLTVADTQAMPADRLEDARSELVDLYGDDAGQAFYDQEYNCSFEAAILGAVYGAWIAKARNEGRICEVPYNPLLPVNTAWDVGHDDATAIWFYQMLHKEVHVIDYHQSNGKDVQFYCDLLDGKPYRYNYGKHTGPHDAANKLLAAGGRSIVAQFRDRGYRLDILPATTHEQSHAAARLTLPHCWFDAEKCEEGIDALGSYRYEWDEKKSKFKSTPLHDWACFVPETMVLTGNGEIRIDSLLVGDMVVTPAGLRRVDAVHKYWATELYEIVTADGRIVRCTGNHKFFTKTGLVRADSLSCGDVLYTGDELSWRIITWILRGAGITGIRAAITASSQPKNKGVRASGTGNCIGTFTRAITARFQMVTRFITSMRIPVTMTSKTLLALQGAPTSACTARLLVEKQRYGMQLRQVKSFIPRCPKSNGDKIQRRCERPLSQDSKKPEMPPRSGTPARKVENGTSNTEKRRGPSALRTLKRLALFAIRILCRTGARQSSVGRIVRLRQLDKGQDVFDLTVNEDHCFIANGILTSNSDGSDAFENLGRAWQPEKTKKPKPAGQPATEQPIVDILNARRRKRLESQL